MHLYLVKLIQYFEFSKCSRNENNKIMFVYRMSSFVSLVNNRIKESRKFEKQKFIPFVKY